MFRHICLLDVTPMCSLKVLLETRYRQQFKRKKANVFISFLREIKADVRIYLLCNIDLKSENKIRPNKIQETESHVLALNTLSRLKGKVHTVFKYLSRRVLRSFSANFSNPLSRNPIILIYQVPKLRTEFHHTSYHHQIYRQAST